MQIKYDQEQDRLLLTLSTQDLYEYDFWITRHLLKGFWGLLHQLLEKNNKDNFEKSKERKEVAEHIKHEKPQPTASQFAQNIARKPLGEEPILLNKIAAKQLENMSYVLHFEDSKGKSMELACDHKIITALSQLLQNAIKQTAWDLNLV